MVKTFQLIDGTTIPAIAWGNGTSGMHGGGQRAVELGKQVLAVGIRHIDTAQYYETEEETRLCIEASGIPRDEVYITTKIWNTDGPPTPEKIRARIQDSIQKLGTVPDLLLIHNPYVPQGNIGGFWKVLEELVEDGTLKGTTLGVSNFRPQDFEEVFKVCKIKPAVNQLEFHPYLLASLDPVMKIHKEHGILTEAFGPLTPVVKHPTGGPLKPILERIAARLSSESGKDIDSASVLLLWTLGRGIIPVTTSSRPENIEKLGAIESLPVLTAADDKEIEEAGRKIHFRNYTTHYKEDYPIPDLPSDI